MPADRCAVAAFAVVETPPAAVAGLRTDPGPAPPGPPPPVSLLRHADEQTVLGLAAVLRAAAALPAPAFDGWGVIAAPRWPGRAVAVDVIGKFRTGGPRTVAPAVIPNHCLHAPSAAVSLYLRSHGPNYGVGGGPGHVADGLLAGLAAQLDHPSPGTWVVLTAGDEDDGVCRAVALALVPVDAPTARMRLRLEPGVGDVEPARLSDFAAFLAGQPGRRWACAADGVGELVLEA